MTLRCVLIASVFLVARSMAQAEEGNCTVREASYRPDCPLAISFLEKLQAALHNNDRNAVASLVHYPLLTTLHAKKVQIASRPELLAHYQEIFDSGVRCAILNATAKDVWGNWQGFMIGNGAIWFDGIIPATEKVDTNAPDYWTKHPLRVITVNNGSAIPCKPK